MKAYFVPAQSEVYANLQEVLTATVKSMVGRYDKQISDPVIQVKGGWSSSKQYFIKVAVYRNNRLVIHRRTVKVIEISANNVPTTTKFLGVEI